jgi:tetratricopeptide (TPR) repeat protein
VLLAVIFFGYDQLTARVRDAARPDSMSTQGRLQIVSDILVAWKRFPLVGTGMGTFEVVYPMFDRSTTASLASHAENEYAQTLLEGGAVAFAIVVIFIVMLGREYVRCLRSAPSPMASVAMGLGFGLGAAMLQSLTDFGQHMPAIGTLSAVCCALIVTLSQASRQTRALPEPRATPPRRGPVRPVRGPGTFIVAAIAALVLFDAVSAARAEWHWQQAGRIEARLQARDWQGDDQTYGRLIAAAATASKLRPADVQYEHWLNEYRWKYIALSADPKTGELRDAVWRERAGRVVAELLEGLRHCPTFGPSYSLAGQIRCKVLGDPRGAELIRTAWKLSRADPIANFEAAMLDADEGNWDSAMAKFRHAAELSSENLEAGADALVRRFHRFDLAMQLAGSNVPATRTIVAALQETGQTDDAAKAAARLAELIKSAAAPSNAPPAALVEAAQMAMQQHDYPAAAEYLHRALNLNLARADLHLDLARALAAQGLLQEAILEARAAEQLGSRDAEAYILELRQRPTSTPATAAPR